MDRTEKKSDDLVDNERWNRKTIVKIYRLLNFKCFVSEKKQFVIIAVAY